MSSSGTQAPPEAEPPGAVDSPATVDVTEEAPDLADTGPSAPDPVRVRFFFVVARTRLDLFLTIRRRFRDDRTVHVLLDRREETRRSRASPVYSPERRQQADRRQRRDYREDLVHHPAVLIPLFPQEDDRNVETSPAGEAPEPDKEATMERELIEEARLLAWVQEGQHVMQQVLPAVLDERDVLKSQLHDMSRRCKALEEENDRLRAEVTRASSAHRQLEQGQAEIGESVDRVLVQITHVLGPMRELAERLATRRRG